MPQLLPVELDLLREFLGSRVWVCINQDVFGSDGMYTRMMKSVSSKLRSLDDKSALYEQGMADGVRATIDFIGSYHKKEQE